MRVGALVVGLTVLALGLAAAATGGSSAPAAIPGCAKSSLNLVADGKLSLATDNPAFPPYFAPNADGHTTAPWELGDPTNGQGFEGAFAYALAEKMGFTKDQVQWTYVPFDASYKPGPKSFDRPAAAVTSENVPSRLLWYRRLGCGR